MPHTIVPTFNQLPVPIQPGIKAVVLDKDNCFAYPHKDEVWHKYKEKWEELKQCYPDAALLIVSNSSGSNDDPGYKQAELLEMNTGVPVLRHSAKKPGCHEEIFSYFHQKKIITKPSEIAIVGDRLFTDVMMANMMGSYSVWVRDGVIKSNNLFSKFEKSLYDFLKSQ